MAAWVQWFHPNGGTSPSKLVLVVIEEASATAQAMVKSGAPSVNHAVLGQALSALSESHPSTRVSFFPRPPARPCSWCGQQIIQIRDILERSSLVVSGDPLEYRLIRLMFLLRLMSQD